MPAASLASWKWRRAWWRIGFASSEPALPQERAAEHVQRPGLHRQVADLPEHLEGLAEAGLAGSPVSRK